MQINFILVGSGFHLYASVFYTDCVIEFCHVLILFGADPVYTNTSGLLQWNWGEYTNVRQKMIPEEYW